MGRDVTGIRTDKKPNPIKLKPDTAVSQETAHVSPKILGLRIEGKIHELNTTAKNDSTMEENQNLKDILETETDSKSDSPRVKKSDSPIKGNGKTDEVVLQTKVIDSEPLASPMNPRAGGKGNGKTDDVVLQTRAIDSEPLASPRTPRAGGKGNGKTDDVVLQTKAIDSEPLASPRTPRAGGKSNDSTEKYLNKIKDIDMPTDANKSQPNSPRGTRNPPQSDNRKQFYEEDNFSVASSAATSAKTAKFKTTVPIAPVFKCVARLEKRKQFYSKLEEKQAAMEAEKLEIEARIKEKEQETIRQLRKNMVFKANPMPSFYQEGPPPKKELKKFPVTRAKSPKLSRRKSCSDATRRSSLDENGKENQHTVGSHRNKRRTSAAPLNNKGQITGNNSDATAGKSMDCSETVSEDTNKPKRHTLTEETSADIVINS